MRCAWSVVVFVVACGAPEQKAETVAPGSPEALAAYLEEVAAYPPAARAEAERGWQLGEAAWNRIVVEPFRGSYAAYGARYAAAIGAFDGKLVRGGKLVARQHYATDPRATPGELWVRWAVPTLYPSRVVAGADGADLGVVFSWDDKGWRALAGLDRAIGDAASALDAKCARFLDAAATKDCADVDYLIVEAAVRSDRAAFARACSLAAARCGIRSAPP